MLFRRSLVVFGLGLGLLLASSGCGSSGSLSPEPEKIKGLEPGDYRDSFDAKKPEKASRSRGSKK